jgi:hypothetical protein
MARTVLTHPLAFPEARPREITGEVELRLAAAAGSRPERVTAFLADAYDRVAGEAADPDAMRRLSAGTRENLLQAAALRFHPSLEWFETACSACGNIYDVAVPLADAPRKPAGDGFPVAEVQTSLGPREFEAPNGFHEEEAARRLSTEPGADARRVFAALCGLSEMAQEDAQRFLTDDLSAIDATLEALCPDVADEACSVCPACGAKTVARVEPLRFGLPKEVDVLQSAHRLARAYGWREEVILALPSARRHAYEAFIAADERRGAAAPRQRV